MNQPRRRDLIYPELSYQVTGVLFTVWSKIGFGHKEKIYQRAVEEEFKNSNLKFKKELPVKIRYRNKFIGLYYFDFLVENKIVLEITKP